MASPPTTPMSQASTKVGSGSSTISDKVNDFRRRAAERIKQATTAQDILIFLIAFRVLNALSIKTFFQPDEFFQSLEPAWEIAFGANSGAWITWEWKNHLRSSIHPALVAAVYWIAANVSSILHLPPAWHADLMINAPKILQAVFAALGDYYTWKLGEKVYGFGSNESWAVLAITVCSPWQWFCSTRTFSNCLEVTFTTVALNYWPWEWSVVSHDEDEEEEKEDDDEDGLRESFEEEQSEELSRSAVEFWDDIMYAVDEQSKLRRCLVLAALACILRPTNILIWICVTGFAVFRVITYGKMVRLPWLGTPVWLHVTDLTLFPATKQQRYTLFREATLCGSAVLITSLIFDRLYYQSWTFPPARFLYFNIAQSLAVFYGKNRWDYYFTEGMPLLLTNFLPFALVGIYRALSTSDHPHQPTQPSNTNPAFSRSVLNQLASTCLLVPVLLSLISHKEVRFIYPLLPSLHILAASPLADFFLPVIQSFTSTSYRLAYSRRPQRLSLPFKRILLGSLLTLNVLVAYLSTTSHQPGPLDVLTYLRKQHIIHDLSQPPLSTYLPRNSAPSAMTVGFLMPCHSTPWRSHLIFPTIKGWALGCEPPLHLNKSERITYLDEADQFYADPVKFIKSTLGPPPPPRQERSWPRWLLGEGWLYKRQVTHHSASSIQTVATSESRITTNSTLTPYDGHPGPKHWPDYLIFFSQLEPVLQEVAGGPQKSAYRECWRGWNSWGHDDWRRKGDIVVWCVRPLETASGRIRKGRP